MRHCLSFVSLLLCDTSDFLIEKTEVFEENINGYKQIFLSSRPRSHLFTWGYSQLILLLIKLPADFVTKEKMADVCKSHGWDKKLHTYTLTLKRDKWKPPVCSFHKRIWLNSVLSLFYYLPLTLFWGWILRVQLNAPCTHFGWVVLLHWVVLLLAFRKFSRFHLFKWMLYCCWLQFRLNIWFLEIFTLLFKILAWIPFSLPGAG